ASIVYDFYVKSTGKGDLYESVLVNFPFIEVSKSAIVRALTLNCLTSAYRDLWQHAWDPEFVSDGWTVDLPGLAEHFPKLSARWHRDCALRADLSRRQALLEIDVLIAEALGLSLEELLTIYRVQFPVMRQYEADTWYDQSGRIVFTPSKGLPGVGFSRAEWNEIRKMRTGTVERVIEDDTQPGGPVTRTITYHAPFFKPDREADYRRAWDEFERRAAREPSAAARTRGALS
ncbi:MAG: hypothetical protein ACREQ8_11475, partial [Woeseiaceae bacterium]